MKKWIRAVLAGIIILALILFGIFAAQNTQKSIKPEQNPEEQNISVSENISGLVTRIFFKGKTVVRNFRWLIF